MREASPNLCNSWVKHLNGVGGSAQEKVPTHIFVEANFTYRGNPCRGSFRVFCILKRLPHEGLDGLAREAGLPMPGRAGASRGGIGDRQGSPYLSLS
jgi:hypothetical protein